MDPEPGARCPGRAPSPGISGATSRRPAPKQQQVAVAVEVPGVLDDEQGEDVEERCRGRPSGPGLGGRRVPADDHDVADAVEQGGQREDDRVGLGHSQRLATWPISEMPRMTAEERPDVGRDLVLCPDLGDHVEGDGDQRGEDQQARARSAGCGLGPAATAAGRGGAGHDGRGRAAVWTTAESVVAGGAAGGGSRLLADVVGEPMTLERTTTEDPRSIGDARRRGHAGRAPGDRRRGRSITSFGYQRFTNRELSRLDFGARLLDLAEDDELAAARAGEVHGHLLRAARRVLPGPGGRPRGPGGGRGPDPLRRRPAPGGAAQGHPGPGRGAGGPPGPDLPRPARAGPRRPPGCGCRTGRRSTTTTGRTWSTSSTGRSSRCSPRWPSTRATRSRTSRTSRSTWWSRWATRATGEQRIARVKVPPVLPRFVVMPDGERFVPLEQVIAAHLDTLFPGMTIGEHDAFRVTRNADLALEEDEADDLLVAVEMELRRRRFGRAVRLEIDAGASPELRELLAAELEVPPDGVYVVDAPIDLGGLWAVYALDRPDLHEETWTPMTPPHLATAGNEPTDLFAVLRERDVLRPPPLRLVRHLGRGLRRPGGRRPRRARHQADPLPDLGRQPDRRVAHPGGRGRQAGGRPRRAEGPLRRAGQHRLGPGPGRGRASTSSTGWSG